MNHYGVLDSVVVIDKGSMVSTKNLVYDAETGNPLLTRTNNEHNRPAYNFTYPAHWAYSGMGQAYKNIDATYSHVNFSHGKLMSLGGNDVNNFLNSVLESGDELYALSKYTGPIEKVGKCDDNAGTDAWTTLAQTSKKKIWAVNTGKASPENPQWIFIDRDGNPFNSTDATIRIVRSGRRNMLDQNVGSVTSMDYPVKNNGKLKFNDAANIIQTGAATFKDHWRVDNSFYVVDSVVEVKVMATVKKRVFDPISTLTTVVYKTQDRDGKEYANGILNQQYFMAERSGTGVGKKWSRHYLSSFAKYNFDSLPADAVILKAELSLKPHYEHGLQPNDVLKHNFPQTRSDFHGLHADRNNPGISDADHFNSAPFQNNVGFRGNYRVNDNRFNFIRFVKDWPTANSSSQVWMSYMRNDANRDLQDNVKVDPIPEHQGSSYMLSETKCQEGRANISSLVKQMISNRSLPSIIGMELEQFTIPYRYSFTKTYPENSHPSTKVCFYPPKLSIFYYICGDDSPSDGWDRDCDPTFSPVECITSQHRLFCFSKFNERKSINPYAEGILGNWRIDTTFVYYGDRKESDPTVDVDTRTGGTIVGYKDFWNLNNNEGGYLSRNIINKDVWVWNSTITQYNRKGYEIENKDPLGRFNAGLYGYDQQLPIAVANNSRVREALFDGFEDYDYQSSQNCITCKPHRSFNYDQNIVDHLDSSQHHTGLKSLRLKAGESISIIAPVTDSLTADRDFGLRMRVDSSKYRDTIVKGKGIGLSGKYDGTRGWRGGPRFSFTRIDPQIDFNWEKGSPGNNMFVDFFTITWTGKIQPRYSDLYTFTATSDDGMKVTVDNKLIINHAIGHSDGSIYLVAGNTYDIKINYNENKGYALAKLEWQSSKQSLEVVPMAQIYPPGRYGDVNGTIEIKESEWCTRLDSANVRGNALTDTFSLLQNKKMLVSAWVKEGGNDCKCSTYTRNNISVSYKGATENATLLASGNIIEGWQRYEGLFDIPHSATDIKLTLNNTSDRDTVYFDDIRIHPFNANMKSFVYHSSNLRLMSELDENNYATFYEYDDDGTLTRVKKETERGIKTITETRSAMQKVVRE